MVPPIVHTGGEHRAAPSRQLHRACDACAVRKVKCGGIAPCARCVQKDIKCTHLRQKKKSGPKNLHKKTLQTISEFTQSQLQLDHAGPVVTNALTTHAPNADKMNQDVIELLSIIKTIGVVTEIIESLTVLSLSADHEEFIQVVRDVISMPITSSPPPPHNKGSVLPPPTPYPMPYISKLCVSYTLCLMTLETILNMIELNQMEFPLSKPIEEFMYLQQDLVYKVNEYALVIETEIRLSFNPIEQSIFYHHSLTFLHLYNYYQVCLIRLPQHRKYNKFLYLRQAVNFYQLLDLSQHLPDPANQDQVFIEKVYEVYEILFIIERINFFLLDKNCIMNNNMVMLLNERDFGWKNVQMEKRILDGKNQLSRLLKTTLENRDYLGMFKFFNNFLLLMDEDLNLSKSDRSVEEFGDVFEVDEFLEYCAKSNITIPALNQLIVDLDSLEQRSETVYSSFMQIFTLLIIFKVDMARTIIREERVTCNQRFLSLLIERLMKTIRGTDPRILNIKCHNYQLLPQLLTMLKMGIEFGEQEDPVLYLEPFDNLQFKLQLIDYLCTLLDLSPKGYNLNQYIVSSKTLSIWFGSIRQQQQQRGKQEDTEEEYMHIVNNAEGEYSSDTLQQQFLPLPEGIEPFGGLETTKINLSQSSKDLLDQLYQPNGKEELEGGSRKGSLGDYFLYYAPPTGA